MKTVIEKFGHSIKEVILMGQLTNQPKQIPQMQTQ